MMLQSAFHYLFCLKFLFKLITFCKIYARKQGGGVFSEPSVVIICQCRRKIGLWRFVYMMLSTCKLCSAYDAVYLYLRTVNQTIAKGNSDYRNGRLIRNNTIGQRFSGKF